MDVISPMLPTSYVAYDLETSGFFPKGEIVEFGAVRVEDGAVTGEFQELCRLGVPMDPRAAAVNHITDEMLDGSRSLTDVFRDFVEFVGTLPLVGYNNRRFDDQFIAREVARTGSADPLSNGSHDVMALHGRQSLARCCEEFGVVNDEAHRALSDARATAMIFSKLRARAREATSSVDGHEPAPRTQT